MQERLYWLSFSSFSGIGPKRFVQLLDAFGTAKDAWHAEKKDLLPILKESWTEKFLEFRSSFDTEVYAKQLLQKEVDFVIHSDDDYPELLKQIENPPFVLYIKGLKSILNEKHMYVGVVGTRRITRYGREVTEMFTESLVRTNCIIVSGLAMGVDAVAHGTTIQNHGKTIAVLGCGVDICYPTSNQNVYNAIITSGGAIVSEFPIGMTPTMGSFPSRNRIIAGLSHAVLVTEGAEDSGALITADESLKIGRKAYAVPGPITSSLSKGPFKLIANGGKLVTSPDELLLDLGLKGDRGAKGDKVIIGETEEEQKIIDLLQNESLHFDELVRLTNMSSVQLGTVLSLMEMKGFIKNIDGGSYSLLT